MKTSFMLSASIFLLFSSFQLQSMDAGVIISGGGLWNPGSSRTYGRTGASFASCPKEVKLAFTKKKRKVKFPEKKIISFTETLKESKKWNDPFEFYFTDLLKKIVVCRANKEQSEAMYKLFTVVNKMRKNLKNTEVDKCVRLLLKEVRDEKIKLNNEVKCLEKEKENFLFQIKAVEVQQRQLEASMQKNHQRTKALESL